MPLQLHANSPVRMARSNIHGWGIFATNIIIPGQFVMEYVGEIIDPYTADLRGKIYDNIEGCSYLFDLNDELVCMYPCLFL